MQLKPIDWLISEPRPIIVRSSSFNRRLLELNSSRLQKMGEYAAIYVQKLDHASS